MPVRDRIADQLTRLAKRFGTAIPASYTEGETAAGMDHSTPFGPGKPLQPYDGYGRTPRSHEFTPQYNVSARPRSHERIAFSTLRALIDAYDFAQICIWHRIDSIRSLDRSLVAADGYEGDVTDAVKIGEAFLKKPDRETPWDAWLAEYLYDVLAYDAGALSRMRDGLGRTVGLRTVDGTTLAPLLDDWGNTPQYPAEAYVQYVNGLPWNWLTERDLIYRPFRKRSNSPYGSAPMESLLLNANTDLRFQAYFLQRFTEGNIPRAFASAPESWTPDQIEQFQQAWDALMRGDQEILSQIKWIPGGGSIAWSDEKDFSDTFSLFMMRKTAAGYHVVPADLGFTETVNKSSGETQSDVQHRLGDTPLAKHIDGLLTAVLQDDLGLPIQHKFDLGEEQDDRLATAQSDFIYWRMAAVGTSEIRAMRYGLTEPEGKPVPRTFFTERAGPIPISALDAVAGPVDQLTGAPQPGAPLPEREFLPIEGALPNPPPDAPPLAEQIYGPSAVIGIPQPPGVAKDAAPTAGITAATGVFGYDLVGHDDSEEVDEPPAAPHVVKAAQVRANELAAFRAYVRTTRRINRPWRDFQFTAHTVIEAHRLNDSGRLAVRKAAGQVAVAGLAVYAADTGRVLMLQRALDETDPAAGTWEFPGGHLESDETPLAGAAREWAEETGCAPPAGHQTGTWLSPDGIYQGIVWTVPSEDTVPVFEDREQVTNPDDPDGDQVEALAWWDPAQLPGNPAVRPELLASIDTVMAALGAVVAKAGGPNPKAQAPAEGQPAAQAWPGWHRDQATAAVWAPRIRAAAYRAARPDALAQAWLTAHQALRKDPGDGTPDAEDWLDTQGIDLAALLTGTLIGIWSEGYVIGVLSAQALLTGSVSVDWSAWTPGDPQAALLVLGEDGAGSGLQILLDQAGISVDSIARSRLGKLAKALAKALERGDSADTLAAVLRGILDDPAWAEMVAITELARATSAASMNTYRDNGVEATYWATADDDRVCLPCEENEAQGAVPLGASFPSSDVSPPGHPLCRCALTPVIVSRADIDPADLAGTGSEND